MSSRSFAVGNYTRHTQEPENEFDSRVRAFKDDSLDTLPDTFENWPKEKVKEAVTGLQRADAKLTAQRTNADVFVAAHPEFLDTKKNGERMNAMLQSLFGDGVFTPEQFETAYQALLVTNSLEIDKAEVVKQQQKLADEQRARSNRVSVAPTEADLWSMPLEDLRRLDAIENKKEFEKRAREGGW